MSAAAHDAEMGTPARGAGDSVPHDICGGACVCRRRLITTNLTRRDGASRRAWHGAYGTHDSAWKRIGGTSAGGGGSPTGFPSGLASAGLQ